MSKVELAKIVLSLIFWLGVMNSALATTVQLSQIPVGKVVSVNGMKFVKITGNQYMAVEPLGAMQGWNGCKSLLTPSGANFTQGPTLMDARDGKKYEIRKFSDGKCWMVDNLKYGGSVDNCANRTTLIYDQADPSNIFGAGTYGDCRDPSVGTPSYGDYNANGYCSANLCGYFYNWQAVMQYPSAYTNNSWAPVAQDYPWQGICPSGWHVPTGGNDDSLELNYLFGHVTPYTNWKIVYGGDAVDGRIGWQGAQHELYTSTPESANSACMLDSATLSTSVYYIFCGHSSIPKNRAFAVRCVKN
jgi:uncharacterized protein (TIGR02145 family)